LHQFNTFLRNKILEKLKIPKFVHEMHPNNQTIPVFHRIREKKKEFEKFSKCKTRFLKITMRSLIYSHCIPFDLFYNQPKLKMNTLFLKVRRQQNNYAR